MIVFTLPSHDLVFKVIRDRFGAPKTNSRADVIERYQFVFRHDRAGRLVDAQEFKRLRLPRARFMQELADELLRDASESCRIEGEHLIVEHCYIERRLRPLNLFLREADPAAAEAAMIDYGDSLRDLAASNVFPGDLLLKNFGVHQPRPRHLLRLRRAVPGIRLRLSRPAAAALRGGRGERGAMVSVRAERRISRAVASVPLHSEGLGTGISRAPRRALDRGLVARHGPRAPSRKFSLRPARFRPPAPTGSPSAWPSPRARLLPERL